MREAVRVTPIIILVLALAAPPAPAQQEENEQFSPLVLEGIELFRQKKMDEAISTIERAIRENPDDALAYNALGVIYTQKGDFENALTSFDKAIALKKPYFKAIYNKFNLLISNGKIDDAEALMRDLTTRYPEHADGWINLAVLMGNLGRADEAVGYLDKALALDAKDFDALTKKGQLLFLDTRYDEALACFNRALEYAPGYPPADDFKKLTSDIIEKKKQGYIRIRQILLPNPEIAQRVKQELDNGGDFARLAAQNSIDSSRNHGGDLGFVKPGELIAAIEQVIFKLEVGHVSGVIVTPRGFHIFKREE
jgi:tetratricopeptide (TPR) repeat protein